MKIAISGPAASGKGTISRLLACRLGYDYVDIGLIFRACVHVFQQNPVGDFVAIQKLLNRVDFRYRWTEGKSSIEINGVDVTGSLLGNDVAKATSFVCRTPENLLALTDVAEQILSDVDVVVDGRSAGSLILQGADFKFFLTADLDIRAERRAVDLGICVEESMRELRIRDQQDESRELDPLVIPKGAIVIDTGHMSPVETSEQLLLLIRGEKHE